MYPHTVCTLHSPCSQHPKHKYFFIFIYLYFHCLAIWDFGTELKVRIRIVFGSIISHCECILAPFVVFSWYLKERLDTEAVTRDVRLTPVSHMQYVFFFRTHVNGSVRSHQARFLPAVGTRSVMPARSVRACA